MTEDERKNRFYEALESRRTQPRLCGLTVEHGGWSGNKACKPFLKKELKIASDEIFKRLHDSSPKDDGGWVFSQCGGCDHFAAHDADWGICISQESENFGKMVFEHVGCVHHSHFDHSQVPDEN